MLRYSRHTFDITGGASDASYGEVHGAFLVVNMVQYMLRLDVILYSLLVTFNILVSLLNLGRKRRSRSLSASIIIVVQETHQEIR